MLPVQTNQNVSQGASNTPSPQPQVVVRKSSNSGCWVVASIGCAVVLILLACIIAAFVMLVAIGASSGGSSVGESIVYEGGEGKIAVINVDGPIAESSGSGSLLTSAASATPDVINSQLQTALDDPNVHGIILKINSPGGEVVASDLIYRKVKEVREEKPVVTWMSSMAASGGYMIAAGSDKIVAHPGTITGSIGVIMELMSVQGLYEKVGIETRVFKSGEFKDDAGVFDEDPDGEADKIFQSLIDESYENFVSLVSENRGLTIEQVKEIADGRIYSGVQAKELGLVDQVGYMEDAISLVEELTAKNNLTVVEYSFGGFWDSLYQYQQILFDKFALLPETEVPGVKLLYIVDL